MSLKIHIIMNIHLYYIIAMFLTPYLFISIIDVYFKMFYGFCYCY